METAAPGRLELDHAARLDNVAFVRELQSTLRAHKIPIPVLNSSTHKSMPSIIINSTNKHRSKPKHLAISSTFMVHQAIRVM